MSHTTKIKVKAEIILTVISEKILSLDDIQQIAYHTEVRLNEPFLMLNIGSDNVAIRYHFKTARQIKKED